MNIHEIFTKVLSFLSRFHLGRGKDGSLHIEYKHMRVHRYSEHGKGSVGYTDSEVSSNSTAVDDVCDSDIERRS